jgi:Cu2+-containing amine oxidase
MDKDIKESIEVLFHEQQKCSIYAEKAQKLGDAARAKKYLAEKKKLLEAIIELKQQDQLKKAS